jgi:hypothetical protein
MSDRLRKIMTIKWDGITTSEVIREDAVEVRHKLADAAKEFDWEKTLKILNDYPELVNTTRPDGKSLYTPLHQAAYGNAPVNIVQKMLDIGAWRTLRNSDGERPIDIAKQKEYQHLAQVLEPVYKTNVPSEILKKIQKYFHEIILDRASDLVVKANLRLPELEPLLEIEKPQMWFPIPGMYGGFNYWLNLDGQNVKLISESWWRVVEGSGQRHEITDKGWTLIEEGFV